MKTIFLGLLVIFMVLCSGCERRNMEVDLDELKQIPQEQWDKLAEKKIFFGHQSVGQNIIDGIREIVKRDSAIKINIIEAGGSRYPNGGAILHCVIGNNTDPASKLTDFELKLASGAGENVDIAFFKFCYIDYSEGTDVKMVEKKYAETFARLSLTYPRVEFVHVTVPLESSPVGWKESMKRLLGRSTWTDAANIKRNEFNQWLLAEFGSRVFDLAGVEATQNRGRVTSFRMGGKQYLSLSTEYTSDGGHLNELGKVVVAKALLKFLATH